MINFILSISLTVQLNFICPNWKTAFIMFLYLSSIILMLIFRINKIGVVTQYLLVYCFLSIVILLLGYFLYIYDFVYNSKLLFITIICMIIGLVSISVYGYLKNNKTNKKNHLLMVLFILEFPLVRGFNGNGNY